ncbi:OmpP1/FadL family transporter [Szabonella alba]|uniref:Outer membrane protein transport protein n=1 Tax=Szabonella alba TaxID=2804194 RepID=A0A8K0VD93_9RHOB|nr:outer membrane protein transport protein [Szabonella alba]MBL4917187.1 outer membrane protein transport protein [Szabonella alba]
MKKITSILGASALTAIAATSASAGGIDRSGQGIGILFEQGRMIELSFGHVSPSVSGNDLAMFGGGASGDVVDDFTQLSLGYKYDINDSLSFALIIDQPFGAEVSYAPSSVALGGTAADADATAVTGLLRYKMGNGFSVHGGVRYQKSKANVDLRGAAYGPLNGYSVDLEADAGIGYVVGVAYERPDIALRVALTYHSAVKHKFNTLETLNGAPIGPMSITNVKTPQSVNLDFQTGIAADTLIFGQIRWADWSEFRLDPAVFTGLAGDGLISLDDTTTFTIGVGRRFNDNWSGAFSVSYEKKGNPLVSPLAPTTGRLGATLAAVYTNGNMKVTTGINYTKLGDANPETGTPDTARAEFRDNKAFGVGIKVGYRF